MLAGVPADARVSTEETFGPVAPVVAIDSLERRDRAGQRVAVRPAGGDLHRRHRARAEVRRPGADRLGQHQRVQQLLGGHLPFGGRAGTDSGIGKVGGAHVMHSFTELQTIVITPDRRSTVSSAARRRPGRARCWPRCSSARRARSSELEAETGTDADELAAVLGGARAPRAGGARRRPRQRPPRAGRAALRALGPRARRSGRAGPAEHAAAGRRERRDGEPDPAAARRHRGDRPGRRLAPARRHQLGRPAAGASHAPPRARCSSPSAPRRCPSGELEAPDAGHDHRPRAARRPSSRRCASAATRRWSTSSRPACRRWRRRSASAAARWSRCCASPARRCGSRRSGWSCSGRVTVEQADEISVRLGYEPR